jgi:hypothetical protein
MSSNLRATTMIDAPVLEVFDYIASPGHLPEWVPFYSAVEPTGGDTPQKGSAFVARFSMLPTLMDQMPLFAQLAPFASLRIRVSIDDIVPGRRIAYRANDLAWSTICDFEPSAGRTILTTTHSLWSTTGLLWLGPMQMIADSFLQQVLDGLKRRLEGRAVDPKPRIFFSYRRTDSPYAGGRVFDALTSEFGAGTVFRDTDSLTAGGDWGIDLITAVQQCRVIVVHIGDEWEDRLLKNAGKDDALRDELEAALTNNARLIPVITSEHRTFAVYDRMKRIQDTLAKMPPAIGKRIRSQFNTRLQAQFLRHDPDFRPDLERLMRSVWHAYRKSQPPS